MKGLLLGWDEISDNDKQSIYQLVVNHTRRHHCCRVGWACKEILKMGVQPNVLDKVAAKSVESSEFIKENANHLFPNDWNITRNPGRGQFRKAVITTLLGVFIGFSLTTGLEVAKVKWLQPATTSPFILPKIQLVHDTIYIESIKAIKKPK